MTRASRRKMIAGVVGAALAGTASPPALVLAEPSDRDLLLTGFLLAPPTYFLGVTLHEGSHALAAKLVGADLVSMSILPGRDQRTGAFHFGLTRVAKLHGRGNQAFFYVAPKITDSVLLAGFGALVLTDGWPRNRYGQLVLTVVASGLWIDFAKDVLTFSKFNDVTKLGNLYCVNTEWRRLPARLLYGAVAAGFGYLVYRGIERTFDASAASATSTTVRYAEPPPWSASLYSTNF